MAYRFAVEEVDRQIAKILRDNADVIAEQIIDRHDEAYPSTNLRLISREERMRWVESWLEFIAHCTEQGEFVPWAYAHLANISGNFRRDLPPYYEIGDFYENTLPMETCMLPFIWERFSADVRQLRHAVERLRLIIAFYIRANVDPVYDRVAQYEERLVETARQKEREEVFETLGAPFVAQIGDLAQRIADLGDLIDGGNYKDARSLLTVCRLQIAELLDNIRGGEDDRAASDGAQKNPAPDTEPRIEPPEQVPAPHAPFDRSAAVSKREVSVLTGVSQGKTNQEIAADLGLSVGTVRNYVSSLMLKLGADNRAQLAVLAMRQGLLE